MTWETGACLWWGVCLCWIRTSILDYLGQASMVDLKACVPLACSFFRVAHSSNTKHQLPVCLFPHADKSDWMVSKSKWLLQQQLLGSMLGGWIWQWLCHEGIDWVAVLSMWLCMKWRSAWLYGVRRTCAETAAVSCGPSHASALSTPLQWIFKKKTL